MRDMNCRRELPLPRQIQLPRRRQFNCLNDGNSKPSEKQESFCICKNKKVFIDLKNKKGFRELFPHERYMNCLDDGNAIALTTAIRILRKNEKVFYL